MNFTRILGQNDKIYRKFGDYCIAEENNECFIVCNCCQQEHQTEESFWLHIHDEHNYQLPETMLHILSQTLHEQQKDNPPEAKRMKLESIPDSEMYVEAEIMDQLSSDINEPDITNASSPFSIKDEDAHGDLEKPKSKQLKNLQHAITAHTTSQKTIDVERISSKSLLNGKVLKKLFVEMQHTNVEFKYKLNRLAQKISVLERELHDESSTPQKKYMKIIPDIPLTTRDEVLILDGELQRSKEMRNSLHDEALMVITQSPDVYCRVLWRFIMTDEISNQFCWRGVIDNDRITKFPIKDMMIYEIFQGAFREKFPSLPLNIFKEKTITYFNKANERIKRNNKIKSDETIDEISEDIS